MPRLHVLPAVVRAAQARPASFQFAAGSARHQSTNAKTSSQPLSTATLSPRWLSDVKQRIGKCITFGLKPQQVSEASTIIQEISRDWRELSAGGEGFLTGPDRRGLYKQEIVWGEMDSMGHVNNVMYMRYAESGRVNWTRRLAVLDPENGATWRNLLNPTGVGLILKSITTEFKFPMVWPDKISVYHKLRSEPTPGTESFILDVIIMSERHQRPAARCIEDVVVYDYQIGKKTPLKPFMLDVFKETWRLQQEAKAVNSQRVSRLLDRVRQLETDSWDRADAVEDLGGAGS
ncbi:Thioesterase-like superfamily [Teratosphaeria destructans]|uniref:Thioesterase-like superfamily n=1 Tax=Teratosphaeria destructans TaxID=418781 RepID=A0A9W7SMS0_9PEZI|nr:Thioesterase-like superfamily [Teratosphaeria destructans]